MPKRYRKGDMVVDAMRYNPSQTVDALAFADCGRWAKFSFHTKDLIIKMPDGGERLAYAGDYLVKMPDKSILPIAPAIFEQAYEEVSDDNFGGK